MIDRDALLAQVRQANPTPGNAALPPDLLARRPPLDLLIEEEIIMLDQKTNATSAESARRRRIGGPVIAAIAAVAVIAVFVTGTLFLGGTDDASGPSGSSEATTTTQPSIVDRYGLDELPEPRTQDDVNAVFLAMPAEIDDMTAYRDDPEHVGFVDYTGDESFARIAWIEAGFDRASVIEFMAAAEGEPAFTVVGSDLADDAQFVWIEATGPSENGTVHMLWWGEPSDGWIFSAEADSAEHLDALIEAFTAAASQ